MAVSLDPRPASERATATAPRWDLDRLAPAVYVLAAAAAFVYVIWRGQGNTFFYDEWTWMVTRRSGLHAVLSAYNQQMELAPTLLYQVLFRIVGLAHYWVYRVLMALAEVALVSTVFVYVRRRIGAGAVPLCVPLLFLGSGWEYVLWTVNIGFVASIALGVGALLALDRDRRRSGPLACAMLVASLLCTEYALVFAVATGVELVWRDRSWRRAYVWLTPIVLFGIWWVPYHQGTGIRNNLTVVPSFVMELAAAALSGFVGLSQDIVSSDWGPSLVIAAIALLALRYRRPGTLTPRAAGVLAGAVAFWVLVAAGRANLGDPTASRYVYTGSVMGVLIAADALRGRRISRRALALGSVISLAAIAGNLRVMRMGEGELSAGSATSRAELAAADLSPGIVSPALYVDAKYMPGLTVGEIEQATRQLGSTPADSPAQLQREPEFARTAADGLLVRAGGLAAAVAPAGMRPPGRVAPPTVVFAAVGGVRRHGGCVSLVHSGSGAALDLVVGTAGLLVQLASGPDAQLYARRYATGFESSSIASVSPARPLLITARADRSPASWVVRLSPQQSATVCTAS